jgi:hypothetical protein
MRLPARPSWLTRGQTLAIVGAGTSALIVAAVIVVLQPGDDTTVAATAGASSSTTVEETTTSTDRATTSTTATTTTTTEATSSTATPVTAPATTAAPTATAPPAPGPLDMSAVLSFAKAGVGSAVPPSTHTGASVCPAFVNRPSDAGDNAVRDISDWYLARYCDGVYRAVLATTTDTPLDSAWVQADTEAGGCSGIDVVVIGWHTTTSGGGTGGAGAVVATPRCERASWRWVDAAGFPVFNGSWLQLDFRGSALGDPSAFDWRGAVRAPGESGAAIDMVPNGGPEHFIR